MAHRGPRGDSIFIFNVKQINPGSVPVFFCPFWLRFLNMGSDLAALVRLNLVQLVLVKFNSVGKKSGKSAVGSELPHSLRCAADFVGKGKQKGKWLPNKIYNFTARDQALARSPPKWDWSASII